MYPIISMATKIGTNTSRYKGEYVICTSIKVGHTANTEYDKFINIALR